MEIRMRRCRQRLTEECTKEILSKVTHGVLSLVDSEGEPYGVPISYVYDGHKCIYSHSAIQGHKIDCIELNQRCSFCVVAQDLIIPEEFTSYFRSVIVRGIIHIVSDPDEIIRGLSLLCDKYSPGIDATSEISRCLSHVTVLRLDIESMTGKEAIELVGKRE